MKKTSLFLLLMASALCLGVLASCSNDGKTHIDLSRQEEIMRKCFDAAQSDELLKHHECYMYTWSNPTNPNAVDQLHYVDKECVYRDWHMKQYELDFYDERVSVIANFATGAFDVAVNLNDEKIKPYHIYIEPFEEFFNLNDGDDITDIYTKDGRLYVESKYTQARAEEYAKTYLLTEPLGNGYITTLLVADATSYEPIETSVTLHKDGKETTCYKVEVQYDMDPPSEALILYTYRNRPSKRYSNIKVHVNPNSEHAFDVEFKVPSYTNITFLHHGNVAERDGYVYFDDIDATSLSSWDRYSDMERFVFTNPSQELIDKYNECLAQILAAQ